MFFKKHSDFTSFHEAAMTPIRKDRENSVLRHKREMRDRFAIAALSIIPHMFDVKETRDSVIALNAYDLADAMMEEREKRLRGEKSDE